jgi:hypothetical protein
MKMSNETKEKIRTKFAMTRERDSLSRFIKIKKGV